MAIAAASASRAKIDFTTSLQADQISETCDASNTSTFASPLLTSIVITDSHSRPAVLNGLKTDYSQERTAQIFTNATKDAELSGSQLSPILACNDLLRPSSSEVLA